MNINNSNFKTMFKIIYLFFWMLLFLPVGWEITTDPTSKPTGGNRYTDDTTTDTDDDDDTPVVIFDDRDTLADCQVKTYEVLRSGTFTIRITVDHTDGLELYYNGVYRRRVSSSYSETRYFSSGDLIKLENDALFCLGASITYTIYIGD